MEKVLLIESIAMSHNAKYYVKCLKRNKVHSSDIKGLWTKKKYSEKIYGIDTLTDTATVNFGCASSLSQSKKDNVINVVKLINILFPLCYIEQILLILVFWTNCFFLFKGSLSNFASVKFVSVERNFLWIAKKLTSISSFNLQSLKICVFQFSSYSLHIWKKWEQLLMDASEITTLFLPPMDCVKN